MPLAILKSTAVDGIGTHCFICGYRWTMIFLTIEKFPESGADRIASPLHPLSARDSLLDRKLAVFHMEML